MQKVTDFLEKNVQWVAIALGALFALWMAYGYWVQSPASVQVDGTTFTAGEVARHTQDTVASQLNSKINSAQTVAMAVPQPAEKFKAEMAWRDVPDTVLAYIWPSLTPEVQAASAPATPGGPNVPNGPTPVAQGPMVDHLPIPPAAKPEEAKVGRSTVQLPNPPAGTVAAAGANAPAPGQPAGPPTKDLDWVTQGFSIPMADLDAAFKAAKIPPGPPLYTTCFLQVEMVRQEVTYDGKNVGPEQVVETMNPTSSGEAVPAFPGDNNPDRQADAAYLAWAQQHTQQILQPPFYQIVKGDQWLPPGSAAQVQQQNQWTLDNPPPGWQTDPQWHDAVMEHRRQKYKEKQDQERQSHPTGGGGPTGVIGRPPAGGIGAPAPRDTGRPTPPPRSQEGVAPPSVPGGPATGMPFNPAVGEGAAGAVAANPTGPVGTLPSGDFDPSKFKDPLQIWAHDTHVTPGKTYKYKVRYRIRNPLFGVINVAKNPQLANVFAIVSADSDWSKPVTVPNKTNFFVARNPFADKVTFDVFKWEDGVQHLATFTVSPGDTLGRQDNDIDFTTDWTVVGFQQDPRTQDMQILLVDKDGNLMTRSSRADQTNQLYKTLRDQVNSQKQANAGGGPGVPGAVPR